MSIHPESVSTLPVSHEGPLGIAEERRTLVARRQAMWASSLPTAQGKEYPAQDVTEMVWADGEKTYACDVCDAIYSTVGAAKTHAYMKHRRPQTPKVKVNGSSDLADVILLITRQFGELQREVDEWKRRARDAEKRLATLKRALR